MALAVGLTRIFFPSALAIVATPTSTRYVAVLSDDIVYAGTLGPTILLAIFEFILAATIEHGRFLGEGALRFESIALAAGCALLIVTERQLEILMCDEESGLGERFERNVCRISMAWVYTEGPGSHVSEGVSSHADLVELTILG